MGEKEKVGLTSPSFESKKGDTHRAEVVQCQVPIHQPIVVKATFQQTIVVKATQGGNGVAPSTMTNSDSASKIDTVLPLKNSITTPSSPKTHSSSDGLATNSMQLIEASDCHRAGVSNVVSRFDEVEEGEVVESESDDEVKLTHVCISSESKEKRDESQISKKRSMGTLSGLSPTKRMKGEIKEVSRSRENDDDIISQNKMTNPLLEAPTIRDEGIIKKYDKKRSISPLLEPSQNKRLRGDPKENSGGDENDRKHCVTNPIMNITTDILVNKRPKVDVKEDTVVEGSKSDEYISPVITISTFSHFIYNNYYMCIVSKGGARESW